MPDFEADLLNNYLMLGAIVFSLGLVGFIARRNMIVMFLCAEMMLQGVSLTLVAFSRLHNDWGGQMLVVFGIAVAACEAAIALALVLMLYRSKGNLDITMWQDIRESNITVTIDNELPESTRTGEEQWPILTPAGVEPDTQDENRMHRSHV